MFKLIYFYLKQPECIIYKILLLGKKNNIETYNDISNYHYKSFIYFYFKLNEALNKHENVSSHIGVNQEYNDFTIELYLLKPINVVEPVLMDTKEFLDIIYNQWLEQLNLKKK